MNGRVVDFPMKVGDAGEAFFVFETEQEVPEEFATSPLAGPSQSKSSEDEIDFLDLAQGGSASHPTAAVATPPSPPDEMGKLKTTKRMHDLLVKLSLTLTSLCGRTQEEHADCGFFFLC